MLRPSKIRKAVSVLLSLSLVATSILLATVMAPTSAAACSAQISLYDNPNYVLDINEAAPLVRCYGSDVANLNAIPFTDLPGNQGPWCGSSLGGRNTWDNCVSSWKFIGSCKYGISLYIDPNFGSLLWTRWGSANFSGGVGYEDNMTSLRFKYRATCPVAPAP